MTLFALAMLLIYSSAQYANKSFFMFDKYVSIFYHNGNAFNDFYLQTKEWQQKIFYQKKNV